LVDFLQAGRGDAKVKSPFLEAIAQLLAPIRGELFGVSQTIDAPGRIQNTGGGIDFRDGGANADLVHAAFQSVGRGRYVVGEKARAESVSLAFCPDHAQ